MVIGEYEGILYDSIYRQKRVPALKSEFTSFSRPTHPREGEGRHGSALDVICVK